MDSETNHNYLLLSSKEYISYDQCWEWYQYFWHMEGLDKIWFY